jgi:translocation and assembly module TamB
MTASWTASEANQQPWRFSFDAKANDFASGWAELDHLLGVTPTLKGEGAWGAKGIEISQTDLTGAAGALTAAGLIGNDSAMALKLGWSAKGPLDVGPLEISGAGKGSGALTGTFANPRADLLADFAVIDLPELTLTNAHVTLSFLKGPADTNGAFTLASGSPYGPAHAQTGFRFIGDGLELTGLAADAGGAHAAGSVALRQGAPSSADLAVSVGPGAFLSRGQASGRLLIAQAGQGGAGQGTAANAHASLKLTANGAMTRAGELLIQTANFSADGPLERMSYRLDASGFSPHGSWKADGTGVLDGVAGSYGATFEGSGRLRNADFKTLEPAVLKLGDHEQSLSFLADIGGGKAKIDAHQGQGGVHATANLSGVSLALLDQDFIGRFDAEISLQGQGPRLDGVMQAKLAGAAEKGAANEPTLDGVVNAALTGPTMTIDAQLGNAQGLSSRAHLVLPAETSAAPFRIALVRTAPMKGDFSADGEVKPLWDLLMGGERSLAGKVHAVGTLSGTLADPQARGEATIAAGQFSDSATGLKLTNVGLSAQLDQSAIDVSQFTGQDGASGSVSGSGRISLERAGASSFRLDLNRFRLIDNDIATAVASGQATISRGADGAVKLTGALSIDRADVAANPPIPSGVTPMDVTEINRTPGAGGGHLQAVNSHAPAVGLDVTLKAPKNVFLKGRGLNVELSLDAHVTGSTATPLLTGAARVVRGDYDFAGKRFQFDNRGVVYLATSADDIRLDLTATRDDPSLTAVIRIEGTAAKPKITLTSTPVLPNDEVLSQVLFGTSASQLSPLDAAELASAMTSLAGGSGFDVVGNLRSFAHLDRLSLGGETTGAIVSGGKYITDNVYLEVSGGANGPTGAVEWRVRKDFSVIGRAASAAGDSQIEVRWRKDY